MQSKSIGSDEKVRPPFQPAQQAKEFSPGRQPHRRQVKL